MSSLVNPMASASAATLTGTAGGGLLTASAELTSRHWAQQTTELAALRQQVADLRRELRTNDLTGIANRRFFLELLEEAMADSGTWSLALGDLNGFKAINDVHGHAAGDLVLIETAYRLAYGAAQIDGAVAAHLSGDEFALLLPHPADSAADLVARIAAVVSAPMRLPSGVRIAVSISMGVTPVIGTDLAALMGQADALMYQTKRGRVCRPLAGDPVPPLGIERRQVRGSATAGRAVGPGFLGRMRLADAGSTS